MKSTKVKIGLAVVLLLGVGMYLFKSPSTTLDESSWPTNEQFVIGMSQEFEALNPIISQMVASNYINLMVLRPINMIDEEWNWQCHLCEEIPSLENGLAKITGSGKTKKVEATFVIKGTAKWGDGQPVTGNDFKLAWEIGRSENVAVGEKETYLEIESVKVDAANPKRFTVTYDKPIYSFYKMTMNNVPLVPAHLEQKVWDATKNQPGAYEKQTVYSTDPLNPGLYNGPYMVSELKLGSHIALVPNPYFYGKAPLIKRLILKVIPNTQTLEANLFSGTIDMISILGLTFDQALTLDKRLKENAKYSGRYAVRFRQGLTYEHIDVNLRNPTLADIRVRKAMMFALDRQKLTDALFEGQQEPALHNIHPLDPYYTDEVEKYSYQPEKAAALLDEAGWKLDPAKGYRFKDGQKLSLTLMTTAQNKTREMVQVYLQNEWKKVGIEIIQRNEPARVYFGETIRKAKYPHLAMYAWVASPDNPPRSTTHSMMIPTAKNAYSGQNSGGWANKEVDDALDKVNVEMDFDKRKELMKVVQQRYAAEVPVIPLYLRSDVAVVPTNLKNYKITGHQFADSQKVEYWDLEGAVAKKN